MGIEDDPLLRRAEAALAEAVRLRRDREETREKTRHRVEELARIEAELDPMLPRRARKRHMVR